jgi:putative addiction module component (TIGR02574 family)
MQLSVEDRALLARDLLESLEPVEPAESVEAAWTSEIEDRAEAYEAGYVTADDWSVSLERVGQRIRH